MTPRPKRRRDLTWLIVLLVVAGMSSGVSAQWVQFVDETATRIDADAEVAVTDNQEKEYAWGDVDRDGDIDLVIVRKEPFTTAGKRVNYLLLNQNGVLTDRTDDFATASSVDAGDLTGDGYPELWFGDYDSSTATGAVESPAGDFDDRLLINAGVVNPGYFLDQTSSRFSGVISVPSFGDVPFQQSAFGAAAKIRDLNGDGAKDIVKQTAADDPLYVGAAYNTPSAPGSFDGADYEVLIQNSPYSVNVGDLNHDNKLDLVITDDGADRYMLNTGNNANGHARMNPSYVFTFLHNGTITGTSAAADDSLGGDSVIADLDKDGWNDVLITDVDVDVPGCDRRMHIYHNRTGTPGQFIQLQEQTTGPAFNTCQNLNSNPPECIVASIPSDRLEGTHDVAVFDINNDTYLDLVVGRCNSTEVYMNVPIGVPAAGGVGEGGFSWQLEVGKDVGQRIQLNWGTSCTVTDSDYSIYQGDIGSWGEHEKLDCSTAGATQQSLLPESGSKYYLVVPHNTVFEGSYGQDSFDVERGQGAEWCRPMNHAACD